MDCARYFRLAELLPLYEGAVRSAITRDLQVERAEQQPHADPGSGMQYQPAGDGGHVAHGGIPGEEPVIVDDIAALAALSQQAGPGFPTIEYRGPGG